MVLFTALLLAYLALNVITLLDTLLAVKFQRKAPTLWLGFGPELKKFGPLSVRRVPILFRAHRATSRPDVKRRVALGLVAALVLPTVFAFLATTAPYSTPTTIVRSTAPDSPANAGGLQPGDKIIAISGTPATSFAEVQKAVSEASQFLTLEYSRGTETFAVSIPANPDVYTAGIVFMGAPTDTTSFGTDVKSSLGFVPDLTVRKITGKAFGDVAELSSNPDEKTFGTSKSVAAFDLPHSLGTFAKFRTLLLAAYFTFVLSLAFVVLSLAEPALRKRFNRTQPR